MLMYNIQNKIFELILTTCAGGQSERARRWRMLSKFFLKYIYWFHGLKNKYFLNYFTSIPLVSVTCISSTLTFIRIRNNNQLNCRQRGLANSNNVFFERLQSSFIYRIDKKCTKKYRLLFTLLWQGCVEYNFIAVRCEKCMSNTVAPAC